ncbi:MAG TPA: vWA domain-containing protein [Thermoanaerobaculia bacterium]|jgi:hypothetical protein
MKRRLAIAVGLLFAAVAARAQERGAVDWIFLVDTSRSMLQNEVFDDVQASIKSFISEARDGDSVSLYTFDRGVRPHSTTAIDGNRNDLFQIVDALEANGNRTHLGAAIERGLERSEELQERTAADKNRVRAIVLFTDGKEDVRGIDNPVPIASNVERVSKSNPYVFFVSMKEHEPQLRAFSTAQLIEATRSEEIRNVAERIRTVVTKPTSPPPQPVVNTTTTPPPPPPPVEEPSLLGRAIKWLIALALLGLAAFFAWRRYQAANRLEGEIEIVRPRVGNDSAFVGLPELKASEIALSAIVPLDALAGSDARLFVRRNGDAKKVCIAARSGSLRVNDIEVPMSELYDADTIQIGDARLRFNRVGHERPQEDGL